MSGRVSLARLFDKRVPFRARLKVLCLGPQARSLLEAALGKRERMLGRLPFHGTAISKSADGIVLGGGSVRLNPGNGESFVMSFLVAGHGPAARVQTIMAQRLSSS
jgi:hypothetical protein